MEDTLGPVEYLVVAFEGNQFKGEIIPALTDLLAQGLICIIDLAVVSKDLAGNVVTLEMTELTPEIAEALAQFDCELPGMLSEEDLIMVAEDLENNTTAAAMLFENVWAGRFAQAVRDANGQMLLNVRIPSDVIEAVRQSLTELE